MLIILALVLLGCSATAAAADAGLAESQTARFHKSKTRPENLSDVDIVNILTAPNSELAKTNIDPEERKARLFRWSDSMRVSIQGAHGEDFDLSSYPGNFIKKYVTELAGYAQVPLLITPAGQKNNNVSIVVVVFKRPEKVISEIKSIQRDYKKNQKTAVDELNSKAGTLYGVQELSDSDKLFGDIAPDPTHGQKSWMSKSYVYDDTSDLPESWWKFFLVGHQIKACKIELLTDTLPTAAWNKNSEKTWHAINESMLNCLGIYADMIPSVLSREIVFDHSFYFLRLLYAQGISPGIPVEDARKILLHDVVLK